LYKIIIKGETDDDLLVVQFVPNRMQRRLLARLHTRNIVLKARQLGITTLFCILWLDTALFTKEPIRCGIIAQDREAAENIFRDKVKFAYDNLPEELRERMPLVKESVSELLFAHNGASIRVAISMRSGTIHRLHISEFGKICAQSPDKALEVVTGSIPAVPKTGIVAIESTAEGQEGKFFTMTQRAMAAAQQRASLSEKDYRFHFFAWWEAPEYSIDPATVLVSDVDHRYFNEVENKIGRKLSAGQRAWWVATRDTDFGGEAPLMWREYPSTPEEAFQASIEGCWYSTQLALARKENRMLDHLPVEAVPINTFWDLGRGDMTAIWFHQRIGPQNRFLRYYENSGEELNHYAAELQKTGYVFGVHYLPHESDHKRQGMTPDTNRSHKEMLEALLPGQRFEVVPRVTSIVTGIQATRNVFSSCLFDNTNCAVGLRRLGNYRKVWNKTQGAWTNEPDHNEDSHGADGFRQFGQEADNGNLFPHGGVTYPGGTSRRTGLRRRVSPMAV
jgi:hypothetical protein